MRPTTYQEAFCEQVISLGHEGASKAEMAHALGCSRQTMDNWAANHPEFLDAVKEAVEASQGWWESEGRKATFGGKPGFNATSFIFNMKNRFPEDWRDKQDHEHSGTLAANVTHNGSLAVSASVTFLTEALGVGAVAAHTESGQD